MNTRIEPYLPQLQSAFEQHDVSLAYLFGSHAKGNPRPDSDLDIAVLFDNTWEGNPFPDTQANLPQTIEKPVGEVSLPRLSDPQAPTHIKLHLAMIGIFHSGSSDDTIRLWDAASGAHKHTLTGHEGSVIPNYFK